MYTYEKRKSTSKPKNNFTTLHNKTVQLMMHEEDPNLNYEKMDELATWRKTHGQYDELLTFIERKLQETFGDEIINEFYKGSHIILSGGNFYDDLRNLLVLMPIPVVVRGAYKKSIFQGSTHYNANEENGFNLDFPQLGIDLPSPMTGHILFGLVSDTMDTFIQTEGAGFQDWNAIFSHGKGALWNTRLFGRWQTGLAGCSKHSEKTGTAIIEKPKDQSDSE